MRVRFLQHVQTGAGTFRPGDEAELAAKNAQPIIDSGAAEMVQPKAEPKAAAKKGRKP